MARPTEAWKWLRLARGFSAVAAGADAEAGHG